MPEFRFSQPENLGVFVCDNVLRHGMPILHVSYDADGDWQFLCGGEHPEGGSDGAAIVCLKDVVLGDPSLNELAELCPLSEAERETPDRPWRIHDRMEDIVRDNVEQHGCHVMLVGAGEEGWPFAYSIGLTKNYGQPELICAGLDSDLMHAMINKIAARMAAGSRFEEGQRVSGLIEGYECELRRMDKGNYAEFLGYARWFYEGDAFDTLQIVWPDKRHRYPWDAEYTAPAAQQPATWRLLSTH